MMHKLCVALTAAFILVTSTITPNLAHAEVATSAFQCKNLEKASEIQLLEGKDGMFFRIIPDIKMFHPFTDATITNLVKIAAALKAKGTTLIYVPVPTKSMVLPDLLPEQAKLYGFDSNIANSIYDEIISRMNTQGVITVDIATAMRAAPEGSNGDFTFFRTDFHWTAQGARAAADEIAKRIAKLPDYQGTPDFAVSPQELPAVQIQSTMHKIVQHFCRSPIPSASAHPYSFEAAVVDILGEGRVEAANADIFAADAPGGIALVGTSYSDMDIANFAGFLQHFTGLPVENHSISGGNQFGSILSYVTSREFAESRPKYLIWENPIYNNLAQFGDAPMLEILAAAEQNCSEKLAVANVDAKSIMVDLSGRDLGETDLVSVDIGADVGRKVRFQFTTATGETRVREMERGERLRATGRYFLPFSDMAGETFQKVLIAFDADVTEKKSVSLCKVQNGDQTQ